MCVVVVGSVALDTIATPTGKIERGLGGSATHFSLAASKFTKPKIVGVVGEDFPEKYIKMLEENDIVTEGIQRAKGKTFHWSGVYGDDFGDPETLKTELGVFEEFKPLVPESYKDSSVLFLANIAPALQSEVVDMMPDSKFIGADTMNFWIEGAKEELLELLKKINLLVINELEVSLLSGKDKLIEGAQDVLEMGPEILIVKRGGVGSVLITKDDYFMLHAYPVELLHDPTGAGDSFAGGMFGYLANENKFDIETLKTAMVYGTITASFGIGEFCTGALEKIDRSVIDDRVEAFRKMTSWELKK